MSSKFPIIYINTQINTYFKSLNFYFKRFYVLILQIVIAQNRFLLK